MGLFDLFRKKAKPAPEPEPVQETVPEPKPESVEETKAPLIENLAPLKEIHAQEDPISETLVEAPIIEEEAAEPDLEFEGVQTQAPSVKNLVRKDLPPEELENKEDLEKSLEKTKTGLFSKLTKAIVGKSTVDVEVLDELEEILVSSDVGVNTTLKIIERIEKRVARDKYLHTSELNNILREEVQALLAENNSNDFENFEYGKQSPYVIMVVGVNGVGKTTTIGKLAHKLKGAGNQVVLGAADTFRAAAVDQLKLWGERVGVRVVAQDMGSDPASVAFDAVQSAAANGDDVAIIDTAGRLHNKVGLMNELSKIKKVMDKIVPGAPHEILLVLDASTGQNAIEQCKQFTEATDVNALALTKLDGTAKGGVVIGISDQFKIPVKYIGVGESIDDLQLFNKKAFVDSLFKN
ncbi:MAG: signal recognition particle-docking protein FtsY [Bacteroidota bacterium]|jgi:fused signal recognition particle receptor